jgi:hypothetical protein
MAYASCVWICPGEQKADNWRKENREQKDKNTAIAFVACYVRCKKAADDPQYN